MRKNTLVFSAASITAAVALLLAGCTMGSDGTGAMTFSFSPTARTLGSGEHYRVEVYYGADLYTSVEQPVGSEADIELAALPVGRVTVYVAQGTGLGESFVATRSGSFQTSIVPGDNSPVALTLGAVPFKAAAGIGSIDSVATLGGGTAYAAGSAGLKKATYASGAFTVTDGPDVPSGVTNVTLSTAWNFTADDYVEQVWVNGNWRLDGNGGIMPWVGDALDTTFVSGFDRAANWSGTPTEFRVLRTGSFRVESAGQEDGLAIFFQRNGGLGGVYVERSETDRAEWPWVIDDIDLSTELEDIVPAGQEPIVDFAIAGRTLYLVTSFTTLRVSEEILDPATEFDAESLLSSELVEFAAGIPATIISIAVYDGAEDDVIYLGTESGLWKGTAGTTAFFKETGTPQIVEGTSGYAIRAIALSGDGEHVAFVSDRSGGPDSLVVDGRIFRTLDGLPGSTLTSLVWLDDYTLLVGGNGGLAALDLRTL